MSVLQDMRVVEGSAFVAVPLAGMTLAQMGAEVIRFDRLEGGLDAHRWPVAKSGKSHFWAGMNKGKKSIAVDMKHPEGRALVSRVITAPGKDAGLFLTNLRVPGWLDHETLAQARPDLVSVTLTGDRHGRPQVDYTVNPAMGIPHITGPEGSTEPVASALPAWDLVAGNLCVSALLAAERHRLRTGAGQAVEIALKDVAAATIGHLGMIGEASEAATVRRKAGNALYGAYGQDFACADGRRVMVIGLTDRQWRGIVTVTGTEAEMQALSKRHGLNLMEEGTRWRLRHEITQILKPWFTARTADEIGKAFDARGLTWSEFRSLKDALAEDPDLSPDNPLFTMAQQPGLGIYPIPGLPAHFSECAAEATVPAPELGQDTEEVLADVAGCDQTEIAQLFDQGVVASPTYNLHRPAA